MGNIIDPNSLHRTAKYFMDNGRAQSHDEAMMLLSQFGLTIYVGREIIDSVHHQNALLTLVNMAVRTLLGGVDVVGLPDTQSLTPLAPKRFLKQAVAELGGRVTTEVNPAWPSAVVGDATGPTTKLPCWRITWNGWRGGVTPFRENKWLQEDEAIAIAPVLAAATCAAEAFAFHAGDHSMAGRRPLGLSLWNPGADWLVDDATESALCFLPSRLWMIGLGNLGQAYAWLLASLPYEDPGLVELVLNDFDRIAPSNESTSVLSRKVDIKRKKTRVVAEWLEARGFTTFLEERRFGEWNKRAPDEPGVALCGVDNTIARAALEKPGFGLVVEAGLGGGPEAFRSMSVHTFPASRSAEEIWSRQVGQGGEDVGDMPAYQSLKRQGLDSCGIAQLASRTVGVPFVGVIAGCLVLSELLRRLNGGQTFELVSGSVSALEDIEVIPRESKAYAFGHLPAVPCPFTIQSDLYG
jgi:hypothetical protein